MFASQKTRRNFVKSRLRIVLANASMADYPQGGGLWTCFLQHLFGLAALGHEVCWLELMRSPPRSTTWRLDSIKRCSPLERNCMTRTAKSRHLACAGILSCRRFICSAGRLAGSGTGRAVHFGDAMELG